MANTRLIIGLLIAAIMLGPLVLGLIFYVVRGLQEDLAASLTVEEGQLKISTFYYDVTIRLSDGAIVYVNLRGPEGELTALDPQGAAHGVLLALGKARLADAGLEWSLESSERLADGSQVAVLRAEWNGVELRARLTAYSWAPILALEVTAANKSGEPVVLESSVGGPMLVLSYAGEAQWRAAATVDNGGVPAIEELQLESGATVRRAFISALFAAEVDGEPRLFYGFRSQGAPLGEVYYNEAYPFTAESKAPVIAFGPGRVELAPGEEATILSVDLALGYFNLHNLALSGLLGEAAVLYPDDYGKLKDYYPFDKNIDELKRRVDTLSNNLDTVIKERDDLRRQLREAQGKEQLLSDKVRELEAQVAMLEEQGRAAKLLAPLAFIAGLVGGGVAAYLALRRG